MFVKMKPVCDCGHIFKELSIVNNDNIGEKDINPHKYIKNQYITTPYICPICGEIIEGVKFTTPSNNIFIYDETKY